MFWINKEKNTMTKVEEPKFSDIGIRERENLQEWIANEPSSLGEDLLIIQKEFDGFNDTNERLDLLAIDKQGNLVVIENKLDDSGKNVVWQVIKYTSYCSTLTKDQIRDIYQSYLDKYSKKESAIENLTEFLNKENFDELQLNQGSSQRIIMISREFKKEVTSAVLWLMNYKLRIQCFKVTPYIVAEKILIDVEQIIPVKDTEEYIISMAKKAQDEISSQEAIKSGDSLRIEFWTLLLNKLNSRSELFKNVNPAKTTWLGTGSGIGNVPFNFLFLKSSVRIDLYIASNSKERNKYIFDELYKYKEEIEGKLQLKLLWERLSEQQNARIKLEKKCKDVYSKENWDDLIIFLSDNMIKMEEAFREPLKKVSELLKKKN